VSAEDTVRRLFAEIAIYREVLERMAARAEGAHSHDTCFCYACEAAKALERAGVREPPEPDDFEPPPGYSGPEWYEEDPGACPECGEPMEWVRPGKTQPTCRCHDPIDGEV